MPEKIKRKRNLLYYFVGSLAFLSIPVLFSPDFSTSLAFLDIDGFREDFIYHILLLSIFFINYLVLVPKFYLTKKYFKYAVIILILFVCASFLPKIIQGENHREHHNKNKTHQQDKFLISKKITDSTFVPINGLQKDSLKVTEIHHNNIRRNRFFFFMLLKDLFQFALICLVGVMLQISRKLKQAESDKLSTELAYLKSQINPHFLFNTLNTIYSLAISKSNNTADAVVKLSNMMRYVLNDASREWVSLEQEISYITNYIELQKMRFENSVEIAFDVDGDSDGKIIAPLLIIPFVENAFKYGINAEQNSSIIIRISIKHSMLQLFVSNNKVDYVESSMDSHGIGIENTKSRLNILYPNTHILSIENNANSYDVSLILQFV